MKYHVPAFAVLALLAVPNFLFSAEKPKESASPAAPVSVTGDNPTLKEVNFHGALLSDVVAYLRQSCPRFKAVVIADPQTPEANPMLPDIELKNIDLKQFLEVLKQTNPLLTIDGVDGQQGPVCLFKLGAPPGAPPMGTGMVGTGGMGFGPPSMPVAQHLQVYRLSQLIPAGAADRAKALNDILSLVQAALEAQGPSANTLMKVHEATGTLIFRGNTAQTEVVDRALQALQPTTAESQRAKLQEQMQAERVRLSDQFQVDRDRMQSRTAQLENRLNEAEKEAAAARKQISEQLTEIEVLKARLAAQGAKTP